MIDTCHNTIGVDISSTSVKAVCLNQDKVIDSYGIVDLEYGANDTDVILALKKVVGSDCTNCDCRVGLRGLDVFTKLIEVEAKDVNELAAGVEAQLADCLPVSLDEVQLSWQVIDRQGEKIKANVIAVPNEIIQRYTRLIEGAGLKLKEFEINAMSLKRALENDMASKCLLVDIHADETDIEFFVDNGLLLDKTIALGGSQITRAISQVSNIDMKEAEKIKRTEREIDDKLFKQAYEPTADKILEEVTKIVALIKMEFNQEPEEVIVTGGDFNTHKFSEYFNNNLGTLLKTKIVIPQAVIKSDNISRESGDKLRLANAIGLAAK